MLHKKNQEEPFPSWFLDLFKLQIFLFPVSKKNLINRERLLKGDKEKGYGGDPSVMCCSSVSHKVVIPGLHVILLASLLSPS